MNQDPKEIIKGLKIIYLALFLGMISFFVVAFFLVSTDEPLGTFDDKSVYVLNTLALLASIGLVPAGYMIYQRKGKQFFYASGNEAKWKAYQEVSILRLACYEAAALINLVIYLLTGSSQPMYTFFILIIIFLVSRPTEQEFVNDFNPESED